MQSAGTSIRVESYGASCPQQGRTQNEDAFIVGREPVPYAVLCDGAGNAERAAKRAIRQFETLLKDAGIEQARTPEGWSKWIRLLDSGFAGGAQTTFLAVVFFGAEYFGGCAGDSRAYLFTRDGDLRILTDGASKQRLGSGSAQAFHFHGTIAPGDILLLASDGCWTPLALPLLKRTIVSGVGKHFSELPQIILDAAGKTGRADDQTCVALRLAR
jgi:serine/threonine protein phosphatase PrpC